MEDIKLPKQFCYDCTIKIESSYTFIKEAQNVNITLKNIASRSETSIIIEPESLKNSSHEPNRLRLTLPDYKLSIGVSNYVEQDIFDDTDYTQRESAIQTKDVQIVPIKPVEVCLNTEKCNTTHISPNRMLEKDNTVKVDETKRDSTNKLKDKNHAQVHAPKLEDNLKINEEKITHITVDETKKNVCPVCRKEFTSKKWYSKHVEKEHSGLKYTCSQCSKCMYVM